MRYSVDALPNNAHFAVWTIEVRFWIIEIRISEGLLYDVSM